MGGDAETLGSNGRRGRRTLPIIQVAAAGDHTRAERRDAAENRRRILETARARFAEAGVDAVSMNEIARAAGIGPGTLYRRYAHKGLLCAALLEENAARFHEGIVSLLRAGETAASPLGGLGDALERLVAYNEENGPLLGAIADAAWGERRVVVYDGPFYRWLHDVVSTLLERAVNAGECRAFDIAWFADALLAPLAIDLYLYQRRVRGFSPERIAAATRQLIAQLRVP